MSTHVPTAVGATSRPWHLDNFIRRWAESITAIKAETMNRHDDQHGTPRHDGADFWGGQADWGTAHEPTTEHQRFDAAEPWASHPDPDASRPVARVRRGLSKLLSSGANPTREHGVIGSLHAAGTTAASTNRTSAALIGPDMFDDRDDDRHDDDTHDDTPGLVADDDTHDAGDDTSGFVTSSDAALADSRAGTAEWDAELAPAPIAGRRDNRIDPLLVRFGAVAIVGTLLVPLLLNTGSDDPDLLNDTAATTQSATPTVDLLTSSTVPNHVVDATTTQLDPNELPAAVPVNTVAPEATTAGAIANDPAVESGVATTSNDAAPATVGNQSAALESPAAADESAIVVPAAADQPAARVKRTCAVDYTVVSGDFWIRLADAAGVEVDELLDANGANASTPLYPGSAICLPAGSTAPAPPTRITVAATTTVAPAPTSTTTPATTLATPTTAASTSPPGPDDIEQIIRDVWPDDLEGRALEIAYRESRYTPTAKNFCCYGLFQIYWEVHKSWLADIGITSDQQLYDPETNARAAYALYQRAGGWGPWGT